METMRTAVLLVAVVTAASGGALAALGCGSPYTSAIVDDMPPVGASTPDTLPPESEAAAPGPISKEDASASDSSPAALSPPRLFDSTYMGWSSGSNTVVEYAIHGAEPAAPGSYPVFIYTVGTFGTYNSISALAWIEYMASRGFVAATVDYSNGPQIGCAALREKAAGIYADPDSAVAKLCARPQASCAKGIVTAGHSQGSLMAILAADYDPRMRAALALGSGYDLWGISLNSELCLANQRVLSFDRVRAVNGISEETFGSAFRHQLDVLTGQTCGSMATTSCLRPNGSGWVLALDADVTDGIADHCYMGVSPNGKGSGCNLASDPSWLATKAAWGRSAGADFLQSFVDP